jgi:hypothetical protein
MPDLFHRTRPAGGLPSGAQSEWVFAKPGIPLTAFNSQKVIAVAYSLVRALAGSVVDAREYSSVTAEAGAQVRGKAGASIIAKEESQIVAEAGCFVTAFRRAKIWYYEGAIIDVKGPYLKGEEPQLYPITDEPLARQG